MTTSPWRAEISATLGLAWPMVLTNLGQTLMTMTDVMMLGRLGPVALAASAIAANVYFLLQMAGLGLMVATLPLCASMLGRNPQGRAGVRRIVRHGLWLAVIIVLPFWLVLWNGERVLLLLGQREELAEAAGPFMRMLMGSLLPYFVYLVLRSFTAAKERPGWALLIVFVAVVLNALANWALIFGHCGLPAMGLAGSGLATTLSSLIMAAGMVLVVVIHPEFRRYRLFVGLWRFERAQMMALLRLGLPISGGVVFEVAIFSVAGLMMGWLDTTSVAAHAIALQIASLSFMVPLGVGQAATVRVGLLDGGGRLEAATRAGWTALMLGVGFMALTALVMLIWPRALVGAYVNLGDPVNGPVVALAVTFLAWAALFQVVDGAQAVGIGMLRGLHDTTWPMLFGVIGYWLVALPVGWWLAFRTPLKGEGIWIGLSVGLAVVAVLLTARWISLTLTMKRRAPLSQE